MTFNYTSTTGATTTTITGTWTGNVSTMTGYSITENLATGSFLWGKSRKIRGRYSVRCSGCGRWVKVVEDFPASFEYATECARCPGVRTGSTR